MSKLRTLIAALIIIPLTIAGAHRVYGIINPPDEHYMLKASASYGIYGGAEILDVTSSLKNCTAEAHVAEKIPDTQFTKWECINIENDLKTSDEHMRKAILNEGSIRDELRKAAGVN